ncbi:MAG: hypothetical protein O2964_03355, partial [Verrucomicrobia bacterium]|nr:hypothetical protein [Verrucomicrobiota bacterium]
RVGESLPGSRLPVSGSDTSLHLMARLTSRDPVEAFEIIHNGEVIRRIAVRDLKGTIEQDLGQAPTDRPGWFLVRAVTSLPYTFRFASTAPFYVVDDNGAIPVREDACQFFLTWARERMNTLSLEDDPLRGEVLEYWKETEVFWMDRLAGIGK